jgi:hypothetical protein
MATYQANITKNIEPAMANPATLQQAGAATRAAITTLGEGAQAAYKGYVEQDIAGFAEAGRAEAAKMFQTNQEAQDAAEAASYMQKNVAPGIFKQAEQAASSPFPEEQAAGMEQLADFGAQLARLKTASQGGMKPEQFIANVDVITRKAISKYPGLASEIRQQVARATGVEGADLFTQQRWISRVLNPKEKDIKDPMQEASNKDMMTFVVDRGALSQEQALRMRDTDPLTYYNTVEKGREAVKQEFVLKAAKTAMDGQLVVNELDANKAWPVIQAAYNAGANTALQNLPTKDLTEISNILMTGIGDPKFDVGALEVRAKGIINNLRGSLDAHLYSTKQAIREQMRRSGTTGSKIEDEQLARVDKLHKETVDMYANEKTAPYLLNILNMKEYEKYTFEQKRSVQTAAVALLGLAGSPAAVSAYFAGGSSRAGVEKQNPELYRLIDNTVTSVVDGGATSTQAAYANMNKLQMYIAEGRKDGKPLTDNKTLTPADIKIGSQLNYEQMKSYFKTNDSAKNLSLEDVNVMSTALTTSSKTGDKWQELGRDYTRLKEGVASMPSEAQEVLKTNGSNTAVGVVADLQREKLAVEKQFNVKLQIGVTPTGKLAVVIPPRVSVQSPRGTLTTAEMKAAAAPVLAEQNLMQAAREFENRATPRMATLSNTRAIVTGEDLKAVSNDYASVINSGQAYTGYYNPKPVAPATQSTTTQSQQVVSQTEIDRMAEQQGVGRDVVIDRAIKSGYTIGE